MEVPERSEEDGGDEEDDDERCDKADEHERLVGDALVLGKRVVERGVGDIERPPVAVHLRTTSERTGTTVSLVRPLKRELDPSRPVSLSLSKTS